jgi:hypothetical protein
MKMGTSVEIVDLEEPLPGRIRVSSCHERWCGLLNYRPCGPTMIHHNGAYMMDFEVNW